MQNSILDYYGLKDRPGIKVQSFQGEYFNPFGNDPSFEALSEIFASRTIILLLCTKSVTILERKLHIAALLERKYSLISETVLERKIETFEGVVRICAVKVHHDQLPILLNILFENTSRSFVIAAHRHIPIEFLNLLVNQFREGVLKLDVLKLCSNSVLGSNMLLLHILRGYDGYSINCFSSTGDDLREP